MAQFARLEGQIQPYAWGGSEYLHQLVPAAGADRNQPAAEYWLGTHASAPAYVVTDSGRQLVEHYLREAGAPPLQFLFKVLDVAQMLSIQTHPTRSQAIEGYAREQAAGIPLDAKHRNYKDQSDKPELMVALSDFYLLHGFADVPTISARLDAYGCLAPLKIKLAREGLKSTFEWVLDTDSQVVRQMQEALAMQLQARDFDKGSVEFWYNRWVEQNSAQSRGLLTLFFFNVVLAPEGEALYQPPGLLHAYLEGRNIELMASSDNVLRAGLTPKHIDVPELLAIGQFSPTDPANYRISPQISELGDRLYPTPFEGFELSYFLGGRHYHYEPRQTEVLFCLEGHAQLQAGDKRLDLGAGAAAVVLPGAAVELTLLDHSQVYRARNL